MEAQTHAWQGHLFQHRLPITKPLHKAATRLGRGMFPWLTTNPFGSLCTGMAHCAHVWLTVSSALYRAPTDRASRDSRGNDCRGHKGRASSGAVVSSVEQW